MNQHQKVLVQVDVLPEVFRKVLEAKQLIATRQAKNSTDACRMVDLSRSAFYKYKDCISFYDEMQVEQTMALYFRLSDQPGVLSGVLKILSDHGANILTVTQNLPLDQVAAVTVTIRIDRKTTDLTALSDQLSEEPGVIEFRKI